MVSRSAQAFGILLAWAVVLWTGQFTATRAQAPAAGTRTSQSDSPARSDSTQSGAVQSEKHWLRKLADAMIGHETHELARSHATVLQAFRETVQLPSRSTVRIWCDDRQVALGTIVDSEGLIATKASELNGAVLCELSDGTRHKAQLVGVDRGSDLALLKVEAQDLPAIRWSDEEPPAVGGWVITPGLNDVPQEIGVVSVAPHHVRGGVLGIQMTEDKLGPRINYVVPNSGAAVAGLSRGDIITHVNGKPLATSDDMIATTSNSLPGDKIQMTILQPLGAKRQISATLGSVATTLSSHRSRFQDHLGGPLSKRRVLFPSVLEHDSVLAPSQCGGVLVNLDGEAIGVNIARASRISSYAIPASVARPILESLKMSAPKSLTVPVATQVLKPTLPESQLTEAVIEQ